MPAFDRLLAVASGRVLRAGEMECLPAALALLAQDRKRAKGVSTVQRDRMIEDVEDSKAHVVAASECRSTALAGPSPSTTCRKNDSNISSVHSGAL